MDFLGFSDALNKRTFEGTSVGGLSALTYDQRRGVYYSLVDNGPKDDAPARFYTLGLPTESGELGEPEILGVTTPEGRERPAVHRFELRRRGYLPYQARRATDLL